MINIFKNLSLVACFALAGCTPSELNTAESTVPSDAQLALCIVDVAEADAGKPIATVLADEFAQCTADVVPIVNVLTATGQMRAEDAKLALKGTAKAK